MCSAGTIGHGNCHRGDTAREGAGRARRVGAASTGGVWNRGDIEGYLPAVPRDVSDPIPSAALEGRVCRGRLEVCRVGGALRGLGNLRALRRGVLPVGTELLVSGRWEAVGRSGGAVDAGEPGVRLSGRQDRLLAGVHVQSTRARSRGLGSQRPPARTSAGPIASNTWRAGTSDAFRRGLPCGCHARARLPGVRVRRVEETARPLKVQHIGADLAGTKVPRQAQRPFLLTADALSDTLALGVPPVGAACRTARFPAHMRSEASGIEVVPPVRRGELGAVAAADPDLILGSHELQGPLYRP